MGKIRKVSAFVLGAAFLGMVIACGGGAPASRPVAGGSQTKPSASSAPSEADGIIGLVAADALSQTGENLENPTASKVEQEGQPPRWVVKATVRKKPVQADVRESETGDLTVRWIMWRGQDALDKPLPHVDAAIAKEEERAKERTSVSGGTSGVGGPDPGPIGEAIDEAKKQVLAHLRYPHDASFPLFQVGARKVDRAGHYPWWTVNGKVKAKNGFGGELTYEYVAWVRKSGGWRCHYLEIDGDVMIQPNPPRIPTDSPKVVRETPVTVAAPPEPETPPQEVTPEPPPTRTWTSSDGQFTVEAEFGGMTGDVVTLIKLDGAKVKVNETQLSQGDRDWIEARRKQRR